MKLLFIFAAFIVLLSASSCKKDVDNDSAQVKVRIDYLGEGGYYNDDIDGVHPPRNPIAEDRWMQVIMFVTSKFELAAWVIETGNVSFYSK